MRRGALPVVGGVGAVIAVVCCAGLPALAAVIGGVGLAGLLGAGGATVVLVAGCLVVGVLVRTRRGRACPTDPDLDGPK